MKNGYLVLFVASALMNIGTAEAGPVSGQGTWETTLQARDLDGDTANGPEAFYDTDLNITWLNTIAPAQGWVPAAFPAEHFGFGGWRLPTLIDTGDCLVHCGYGEQASTSEMAHLFYETLGNLGRCVTGTYRPACVPQLGYGLSNTGDFENLHNGQYWLALQYQPDPSVAWTFDSDGYQGLDGTRNQSYAMAVRAGDVLAVPEPGSMGMTLAAMGVLAMIRRNRRRPANGSTVLE